LALTFVRPDNSSYSLHSCSHLATGCPTSAPMYYWLVRYPYPPSSILIRCRTMGQPNSGNPSYTSPPLSPPSQNQFGPSSPILNGGWLWRKSTPPSCPMSHETWFRTPTEPVLSSTGGYSNTSSRLTGF
jgi:hypothetical protein